jgi:hypothetical protein
MVQQVHFCAYFEEKTCNRPLVLEEYQVRHESIFSIVLPPVW